MSIKEHFRKAFELEKQVKKIPGVTNIRYTRYAGADIPKYMLVDINPDYIECMVDLYELGFNLDHIINESKVTLFKLI